MAPHSQALVPPSALKTFVTHVACTARQHTSAVACHHGTTMATGAGERHWSRGACAVSARLLEAVQALLGPRMDRERLAGLGDTHGPPPARMESLPSCGIVAPQVPCHRVPLPLWPWAAVCACPWDVGQPGPHRPRITRLPGGHERGTEKTGRGCRCEARLAPTRRRARTLAVENRGDGSIVGLAQWIVAALRAVGQPGRWWPAAGRGAPRRGERQRETLPLRLAQGERGFEAFVSLEASGVHGGTQGQALLVGLTPQRHEESPVPSTTAAQAPQAFGAPLTALLTRQGSDDKRGGPDQARLHRRRRLHGEACIHARLIATTTQRAQRLGPHTGGWRGLALRRAAATGIHDGNVRAPAMTALLSGGAQGMLAPCQRQQDTDGHGASAPRGFLRESWVETLLKGADQPC